MKCKIHIVTDGNSTEKVIRRRFIPIRMSITDAGEYVQEEVKLPFTANKVVGVLTTSIVGKPCIDDPAPFRYYYGITEAQMVDTSFLEFDDGNELDDEDEYPPEISFEGDPGQYWYIATPASDRIPYEIWADVIQQLGPPIEISILQDGYCNPQPYHLWSKRIPPTGTVLITFDEFS